MITSGAVNCASAALRLVRGDVAAALLLLFAPAAMAASPWLPEPGQLDVTYVSIYETFDHFYKGSSKTRFPKGTFEQITQALSLDYGLFDNVSVDLTMGYVRVYGDLDTNDGLADTTLGIRLRLVDEFAFDQAWVPTITARFGGIIAGSYDADGESFPGIPGDKADGLETEISIGKLLPYGFGVDGSLGLRARDKGVPLEWHLRTSAFYTAFDIATLSIAYDQWRSTRGTDIGGPGFSPAEFRELKENSSSIEFGLTLNDPGQRVFVTGFYTRTVDGRNTGRKDVGGVTISVPIQTR